MTRLDPPLTTADETTSAPPAAPRTRESASSAATPAAATRAPSILHQPAAVWAIAFACAVSFMGIGLVDPILPAISSELGATPSQTMLLFTSYLLITAVAMFFTGFVSSRLGVRRTLLVGLALVVVFATLAGASGSVEAICECLPGWSGTGWSGWFRSR